jgi:DNA-binding LytR/AlgR family response regulator
MAELPVVTDGWREVSVADHRWVDGRAVIAHEDERTRSELCGALAALWPGLDIRAVEGDGALVLSTCESERPDVLVVGAQLRAMTGVELAHMVSERCLVVLVSSGKDEAADAFEAGAVDYLVHPVAMARMARTVLRLKTRLERDKTPTAHPGSVGHAGPAAARLRWLPTHKEDAILLVDVADICYCQSENKHTAVITADARSAIRTPLKRLVARLDPAHFWQIHRGTVVNVKAIQKVVRDAAGHLEVRLKARHEVLKVSEAFASHFKHL